MTVQEKAADTFTAVSLTLASSSILADLEHIVSIGAGLVAIIAGIYAIRFYMMKLKEGNQNGSDVSD